MSCFVVSEKHIDTIVTGLIDYCGLPESSAVSVGACLWHENHVSYQFRYPTSDGDEATYRMFERREVTATVLVKALTCYVYQSNEHRGWETSAAKGFTDLVLARLQHIATDSLTYGAAPWGIE